MKRSIRLFAALVVLQMAMIARPARVQTEHTFTLDTSSWDAQPKTVALAGDFNEWSTTATPMKQDGKTWTSTVKLSNGPHAYKFVADGERWLQDPKADSALDAGDGNGGKNSVVMIGTKDQAAAPTPAPQGDGVRFSLDTSSWKEQPKTVSVAGDFNDWKTTATPVKKDGHVWSVTVRLTPGVHPYKFVADGERWLQDPKADAALDADDGNGGKNSGIKVEAPPSTRGS